MKHQKYKPQSIRELIDVVKDSSITMKNPKKNVVILRGEKDSLSVFIGRCNNLQQLKTFLYGNTTFSDSDIAQRIQNLQDREECD